MKKLLGISLSGLVETCGNL